MASLWIVVLKVTLPSFRFLKLHEIWDDNLIQIKSQLKSYLILNFPSMGMFWIISNRWMTITKEWILDRIFGPDQTVISQNSNLMVGIFITLLGKLSLHFCPILRHRTESEVSQNWVRSVIRVISTRPVTFWAFFQKTLWVYNVWSAFHQFSIFPEKFRNPGTFLCDACLSRS